MSSTVNLYDVLNLDSDCTKKDIKKAYRKMVKEFHPDHGGDAQLFELITHAFNVLYNDESRSCYDHAYKLSRDAEGDFDDMKSAAQQYFESQEAELDSHRKQFKHNFKTQYPKLSDDDIEKLVNKKMQEFAQVDYASASMELDKKHGYKRGSELDIEISKEEFDKRILDLEDLREQEVVEDEPDALFGDADNFNPAKFNEIWDKMYGAGPMDLMTTNANPMPYEDSGFYSFQSTSEPSLYREEDNVVEENYSSWKTGKHGRKITKDDIKKITGLDHSYNHTAGADTKEYKEMLKKTIKQRNLETKEIDDMEMDDFVDDDTLGGYGISHQIGFKGDEISWDNEDHLRLKYKKLIKHREDMKLLTQDDEIDEDLIDAMRKETKKTKKSKK